MKFPRLRAFRAGSDMTLAQVSEQTGLSISFLSDIERGRTMPSFDSLQRLAKVYNVFPTQLIEDAINDAEGHWDEAQFMVCVNADRFREKDPTLDTLLEEVAELILAYRGKHKDPPKTELTQIGGICINLLRRELAKGAT